MFKVGDKVVFTKLLVSTGSRSFNRHLNDGIVEEKYVGQFATIKQVIHQELNEHSFQCLIGFEDGEALYADFNELETFEHKHVDRPELSSKYKY